MMGTRPSLVGFVAVTMWAHGETTASPHGHVTTHQSKGEVMPLIERVFVLDATPKKENLLALEERVFVFLGDWPSNVDVKANIFKRNARHAGWQSGKVVKRNILRNINFDVRFDGQIVGRSLPVVSQFGMGNERVTTIFIGVDGAFGAVETDIGTELPLSRIIGSRYKVFSRDVESESRNCETGGKGGHDECAEGGEKFVPAFNVVNEPPPMFWEASYFVIWFLDR
jgi:hypothetical protein